MRQDSTDAFLHHRESQVASLFLNAPPPGERDRAVGWRRIRRFIADGYNQQTLLDQEAANLAKLTNLSPGACRNAIVQLANVNSLTAQQASERLTHLAQEGRFDAEYIMPDYVGDWTPVDDETTLDRWQQLCQESIPARGQFPYDLPFRPERTIQWTDDNPPRFGIGIVQDWRHSITFTIGASPDTQRSIRRANYAVRRLNASLHRGWRLGQLPTRPAMPWDDTSTRVPHTRHAAKRGLTIPAFNLTGHITKIATWIDHVDPRPSEDERLWSLLATTHPHWQAVILQRILAKARRDHELLGTLQALAILAHTRRLTIPWRHLLRSKGRKPAFVRRHRAS